ncbi:MAG: hypothetical protein Q8K70_06355 [Bacteroidota bacterium]|nr:hypothetical protein [Bacteroidota bacterium]
MIFNKNHIYVSKIPSEVPLAFFNKNILTDKLIICFPYQLEELEEFKKTMKVKETELWGPERYHENKSNYSKEDIEKHHILKNICYYSSANWYRKIKGNIDLGKFEKENEDLIIKTLITWVKQNPSYSLTIYLHPLERNHKIFKMVQDHYINYHYSDLIIWNKDEASNQSFHLNNIGIGLYSTILFERIFMGFKTLIVPLGFENEFPLSNSNIVNICANSAKQLFSKMDSNINLSANEYYKLNLINNYKNELVN